MGNTVVQAIIDFLLYQSRASYTLCGEIENGNMRNTCLRLIIDFEFYVVYPLCRLVVGGAVARRWARALVMNHGGASTASSVGISVNPCSYSRAPGNERREEGKMEETERKGMWGLR